jgi:hypothetical protein
VRTVLIVFAIIGVVMVVGGIVLSPVKGDDMHQTPAPSTMDKDGTYYHIDDSAAGTYETQGSARTNGRPCNWMRLSADWNKTDTIDGIYASLIDKGDVGRGETARVTVHGGEYFVSYGCEPWHYGG